MMTGSLLAGIAFSHSDVAGVHCIAEALGGKYDAPHGVCNAIALPVMMEYNRDYALERYARIARAMGLPENSARNGSNADNPRPMTANDYLQVLQTLMG
jgi:alcohol dehydrogenase